MQNQTRQVMENSHLFEGLRADLIHEIASSATRKTLSSGEILFQKGDPADALWGVLSGRIVIEVVTEEGKEMVLDTLEQGAVFGEVGVIDFGPRRVDARATEDSQLFKLKRKHFLKYLQGSPELCFRFFSLLCSHLRQTTENLEDTALYKLPGRLAKRLILLSADTQLENGKALHLSQSDLASLLGVNREAVNRHLKVFEKDGLISLSRQKIEIVDRQALVDLSSPGQNSQFDGWGIENQAALKFRTSTFSQPDKDKLAPQEHHSAGLMAIDAAEYSRSLMRDAAGTLKRIEVGLQAVDRAIERHKGHAEWHTGDRVLARFPSAQLAIQAALDIQERVNPVKSAGKGKQDLLFRIGVHYGEVLTGDHKFYDEAVNTVIRLTQLSGVGGVAISGAVRDTLDNHEQLELQYLGDHELKNVPGTTAIYSARAIPLFKMLVLRTKTLVPVRFRPGVIAVALAVILAGIWFAGDHMGRKSAPPTGSQLSIAVLPFKNSGDTSLDYLAKGIPDEIRSSLSLIPAIRVIARNSSDQYNDVPVGSEKITRINDELGVTHVLEGSVHKDGKQIHVIAQLLNSEDSSKLWSETFERSLDEVLMIQNEIASAVTDALRVKLLGAMPGKQAADPSVHALYLKARYFDNLGDHNSRVKAFSAYKQALAIDPEHAPSWVGVAWYYSHLVRNDGLPREEGYVLTLEALENALAADDNLALVWSSLAHFKINFEWDWEGARADLEKALQLEPNNPESIGVAASLAASLGQTVVQIRLREKKVGLDPMNLSSLSGLGLAYLHHNQLDKAREMFERVIVINPDYPRIFERIGRVYLLQGDAGRALIEFNKYPSVRNNVLNKANAHVALGNDSIAQTTIDDYLATSPHEHPLWTAAVFAWQSDNDRAFEWLEKAFQERVVELKYILTNAYLKSLQSDPRYPVFLDKLGLLEAWKAMESE